MFGHPDSIVRASTRNQHVLLIDAQPPTDRVQLLDAPIGLLQLVATLRDTLPEVPTTLVNWNTLSREERDLNLSEQLAKSHPSIVGISAFTAGMPVALHIARQVRRFDPTIPIVLGGHHATANPEGIAKHASIDYYVMGDATESGPALFRHLFDGTGHAPRDIAGVAFREDGAAVLIEGGPDDQPLAAPALATWDWTDLTLPLYRGNRSTRVGDLYYYPTRGELIPFLANKGARCPQPQDVVDRLAAAIALHGSRHILLCDTLQHADRDWVLDVLAQITDQLSVHLMGSVLADDLDVVLVDSMLSAGLRYLGASLEPAWVRSRGAQTERFERFMANVRYASERGAVVSVALRLGRPGETEAEAEALLELAADPAFDLVLCNLFDGSDFGRELIGHGIDLDSALYFQQLADPANLCLAGYERATLERLVDAGRDLSLEKLTRQSTIDKLEAMDLRLGHAHSRAAPTSLNAPTIDPTGEPLRSVSAALGPDWVRQGIVLNGLRLSPGAQSDGALLIDVVDPDSAAGRIGLRMRDDQRHAYMRTARYDLWYEPESAIKRRLLMELIQDLAGRLS